MNDHMHDIINASLKERGLPTIEQGAKPIGSIFGLTDISSSAPLSEQLDEETHLRYGYIPFVIAEVAWDYIDTVLDMTKILKIEETKKLGRKVEEIRKDYLWWKRKFAGDSHFENEEKNMLTFQDELKQFFSSMYCSNSDEIMRLYPDLDGEYKMMIATLYMGIIILDALFMYVRHMEKVVIDKVRHPIGNILPKHLRQLSMLIPEFAGDCPLKEGFEKYRPQYVDDLVNYITSIQLYD